MSDKRRRTSPRAAQATPASKSTQGKKPAPARATHTLPRELLSLPATEAARLVALSYLDDTARAQARLADPDDAEALHDFRVSVRRLRSCLRAYRVFLVGGVPAKSRRQLRALAAATGSGRDSEVQLEWLAGQKLGARHRPGRDWLIGRLEARRHAAYDQIRSDVSTEFARIEQRLTRQLSSYRVEVRRGADALGPTFAVATAEILDAFAADLRDHLGRVHDASDEDEAHEARISAKRLRYLLEPIADQVPSCAPCVSQIKALQEILGQLHDAAVLGAELRPAIETAAAERASRIHDLAVGTRTDGAAGVAGQDTSPGLLALARSVLQRRENGFAELAAGWLRGRADALFEDLQELALELAQAGGAHGRERVYLLRGMPVRLAKVRPVEIDEGWLPGKQIAERVRRARSGNTKGSKGNKERWIRIVGTRGRAVEETTTAEIGRAVWSLTVDKRVHYLRYRVRDGGRVYELRRFEDPILLIAVLRSPRASSPLAREVIPDWLAPAVIREITAEPEYQMAALARRSTKP